MKNKIPIPDSVYEGLAAQVLREKVSPTPFDIEHAELYAEYSEDGYTASVNLVFQMLEIDGSFTHEFGIEVVKDYEPGRVEDYNDYNVFYYDEDNNIEYDLSDDFDIKRLIEIIDTSS